MIKHIIVFIVIIVYDILGTTLVSNDNHVPWSQDDPSGTCTPPTPAVSPSHDPPPPAPPLLHRAMADPSEELLGVANVFLRCQLIEAILMCMEPSILIRFGSSCISALAFKSLSLLSLLSLLQVTAF